jgi:hypothetical protein
MSLASAVYRDGRGTDDRSTEDLKSSMKVQQYTADLDELVDAVCTRIGQNKVAIMKQGSSGCRCTRTTSSQELPCPLK